MAPASVPRPADKPALDGKAALVTGAYGDIGRHTVVGLAAETVLATARSLDVSVNNAAVMPSGQRQTTNDGFELAFGTNHLGHYALTGHLLPALLASPEARAITVCAGPQNRRLDTGDPNSDRNYKGGTRTYMAFKQATAVFAQELARYAFAPVASTPEQAARPSLCAATRAGLDNGTLVGPTGPIGIKGVPGPRKLPAAITDELSADSCGRHRKGSPASDYRLDQSGAPEGYRQ